MCETGLSFVEGPLRGPWMETCGAIACGVGLDDIDQESMALQFVGQIQCKSARTLHLTFWRRWCLRKIG
jgi:hypothetical protein